MPRLNLDEVYTDLEPGVKLTGKIRDLTADTVLTARTRVDEGGLYRLNGFNLTINGPFEAGLFQCFDTSLGGTVSFGGKTPRVLPQWWGAVMDGVADDTVPFHAALTAIKAQRGTVKIIGAMRVTSGYTQSVNYKDVTLEGMNRSKEQDADRFGSVIILDSVDPASFFYLHAARHHLRLRDLTFRSAQFVQDRKFFRYNSGGAYTTAEHLNFESVEKPFCFEDGVYMQSAYFENVQFRSSGTFHSEVTAGFAGNIITLNNVNHEGGVPVNTEKVICNLQRFSGIQGTNVVLEGFGPGADWTVLKLIDPSTVPWARSSLANINGFWSEWTTEPLYVVDQDGGRVTMNAFRATMSTTSRWRITGTASATIVNSALTQTDPIDSCFELADHNQQVIFDRCSIRGSMFPPVSNGRFTFRDCNATRDGTTASEIFASTIFGNGQGAQFGKWDGGYPDGRYTILMGSGATYTPSTDPVYGRKLVITPSAGAFSIYYESPIRGSIPQYSQVNLVMTLRLPVFTSGVVQMFWYEDNISRGTLYSFGVAQSGQVLTINHPQRILTALATELGFRITSGTAVGVVGDLEIMAIAFYLGNEAPRIVYPDYPRNIVTYSNTMPTAGAWTAGDEVRDPSPTVAGVAGSRYIIKGWLRLTTGNAHVLNTDWSEMRTLTGT